MGENILEDYRYFLKDYIRKRIDFSQTAQNQGLPPPPVEKPHPAGAPTVELPRPDAWTDVGQVDLATAIERRRSRRVFQQVPLSMEEISFLLWATQGIRSHPKAGHVYRTVPSAGCRHAFETYLAVLNIETLSPGIYRYLPLSHRLLRQSKDKKLSRKLVPATLGQPYPGSAAVTFVWTAIPYRMEWRYGLAAHKVIALDAGHVCQNLYLACEAIGAGTCAIGAYDQDALDALLEVDGRDEFAVYLAPVGKIGPGESR
jgi:SagB-type dehydrogenase family enzyme